MIEVLNLFPKINEELFELLEGLSDDDWRKQTVVKGRTVKDLATHILDGSMRRLSLARDSFRGEDVNINSYQELIDFIQRINKDWINATRRLSPKILIQLLKTFEGELYNYFRELDLNGTAAFSVDWAGENLSKNWFDIAREYTEKWHHQMQIRLALEKTILTDIEFLKPVYETFMVGLPFAYKDVIAKDKENLKITINGDSGGDWIISYNEKKWSFSNDSSHIIDYEVIISGDIAWRLFTNCIDKEKVKSEMITRGSSYVCENILNMKTVLS